MESHDQCISLDSMRPSVDLKAKINTYVTFNEHSEHSECIKAPSLGGASQPRKLNVTTMEALGGVSDNADTQNKRKSRNNVKQKVNGKLQPSSESNDASVLPKSHRKNIKQHMWESEDELNLLQVKPSPAKKLKKCIEQKHSKVTDCSTPAGDKHKIRNNVTRKRRTSKNGSVTTSPTGHLCEESIANAKCKVQCKKALPLEMAAPEKANVRFKRRKFPPNSRSRDASSEAWQAKPGERKEVLVKMHTSRGPASLSRARPSSTASTHSTPGRTKSVDIRASVKPSTTEHRRSRSRRVSAKHAARTELSAEQQYPSRRKKTPRYSVKTASFSRRRTLSKQTRPLLAGRTTTARSKSSPTLLQRRDPHANTSDANRVVEPPEVVNSSEECSFEEGRKPDHAAQSRSSPTDTDIPDTITTAAPDKDANKQFSATAANAQTQNELTPVVAESNKIQQANELSVAKIPHRNCRQYVQQSRKWKVKACGRGNISGRPTIICIVVKMQNHTANSTTITVDSHKHEVFPGNDSMKVKLEYQTHYVGHSIKLRIQIRLYYENCGHVHWIVLPDEFIDLPGTVRKTSQEPMDESNIKHSTHANSSIPNILIFTHQQCPDNCCALLSAAQPTRLKILDSKWKPSEPFPAASSAHVPAGSTSTPSNEATDNANAKMDEWNIAIFHVKNVVLPESVGKWIDNFLSLDVNSATEQSSKAAIDQPKGVDTAENTAAAAAGAPPPPGSAVAESSAPPAITVAAAANTVARQGASSTVHCKEEIIDIPVHAIKEEPPDDVVVCCSPESSIKLTPEETTMLCDLGVYVQMALATVEYHERIADIAHNNESFYEVQEHEKQKLQKNLLEQCERIYEIIKFSTPIFDRTELFAVLQGNINKISIVKYKEFELKNIIRMFISLHKFYRDRFDGTLSGLDAKMGLNLRHMSIFIAASKKSQTVRSGKAQCRALLPAPVVYEPVDVFEGYPSLCSISPPPIDEDLAVCTTSEVNPPDDRISANQWNTPCAKEPFVHDTVSQRIQQPYYQMQQQQQQQQATLQELPAASNEIQLDNSFEMTPPLHQLRGRSIHEELDRNCQMTPYMDTRWNDESSAPGQQVATVGLARNGHQAEEQWWSAENEPLMEDVRYHVNPNMRQLNCPGILPNYGSTLVKYNGPDYMPNNAGVQSGNLNGEGGNQSMISMPPQAQAHHGWGNGAYMNYLDDYRYCDPNNQFGPPQQLYNDTLPYRANGQQSSAQFSHGLFPSHLAASTSSDNAPPLPGLDPSGPYNVPSQSHMPSKCQRGNVHPQYQQFAGQAYARHCSDCQIPEKPQLRDLASAEAARRRYETDQLPTRSRPRILPELGDTPLTSRAMSPMEDAKVPPVGEGAAVRAPAIRGRRSPPEYPPLQALYF